MNAYLTSRGYPTTKPLDPLVASQLLEDLQIASLLNSQQCMMSDVIYTSPTNGWTKGTMYIMKRKFKHYKTNNLLLPQTIEYKKRALHMMLEIQVLAWDRHTNVVGLNQLIGSQHLDNYNLLQKMSMQLIAIFSYILFISND